MRALLRLSRSIDRMNERVGAALSWIVLIAVFVSAGTATARKAFDVSSNGLLEIQWYLFAAMFLLAAGYTMLRQEHVRIDVLLGRFARRTQVKVEIFGIVVFLFPFVAVMIGLVLPLVVRAFATGEISSNEGGLIRWPVYALVPIGFLLLGLQGVSELVKRVAFLLGMIDDPASRRGQKSAEEELAEALRAQRDEATR
ncbi:MAG: sugar transporter [Burkholderiales bacterium]|nr:MAG: sugar transporter [Burkholderiales bacterium]